MLVHMLLVGVVCVLKERLASYHVHTARERGVVDGVRVNDTDILLLEVSARFWGCKLALFS